jgi:septal ring factor EnvC (AmiA/AmiB activator)
MEGKLPAPVTGKIVDTYGPKIHPITNLRSFSPGITIQAAAGRTVSAVAPGTAAYVGSLRGYGEFIILDHGDQYFTTYAGMENTLVTVGQYVHAGDKLAVVSAEGRVKFELRHGRKTLDPVEWIRIDAF